MFSTTVFFSGIHSAISVKTSSSTSPEFSSRIYQGNLGGTPEILPEISAGILPKFTPISPAFF